MDEPWKEVLLEYRDTIVSSADSNDVLLNCVLDHLLAKRCVQTDHCEIIKREQCARDRFRKLLDFLSSEGCNAFDELCNAFRAFQTDDKVQLANTLQQALKHKREGREIRTTSELHQLKAERDQLKMDNDILQEENNQLITGRDQLQKEKEQWQVERAYFQTKIIQLQDERNKLKTGRDKLHSEKEQWKSEREQLKEKINQLGTERDQLQTEKEKWKAAREQLKEKSIQLETEREQLQTEKDQIHRERDQLKTEVSFCIGKVSLTNSLPEGAAINAVTTLNKELFVHYKGNDIDITVYDTETFQVRRSLRVPGLGDVIDMTSCTRFQCIYISDPDYCVIHRVENENAISQWSVTDTPNGLSINLACNVLVACSNNSQILEFTTKGQKVRVISLNPDIEMLSHAVELDIDVFIIAHGDCDAQLSRVCIIDSSGRVCKSYGDGPGSGSGRLNTPIRLVLINGLLFVADRGNNRVLLLNQSLELIRQVVSGVRPSRMWFDRDAFRLCVADNKLQNGEVVSGQLKVYSEVVSGQLKVYSD